MATKTATATSLPVKATATKALISPRTARRISSVMMFGLMLGIMFVATEGSSHAQMFGELGQIAGTEKIINAGKSMTGFLKVLGGALVVPALGFGGLKIMMSGFSNALQEGGVKAAMMALAGGLFLFLFADPLGSFVTGLATQNP